MHTSIHSGGTGNILPTQWFYGQYVISPGTGLFCPRHLADSRPRNLAPASGVRTTRLHRPSQHRSLSAPQRPPHPALRTWRSRVAFSVGKGRCNQYC